MMEHLCCFCGEAWSAYDDSSGESVSVKNVIYRMATVDNELTTVTICHLHFRHQSKRLSFLLCFFCVKWQTSQIHLLLRNTTILL
jgi:hypothetical protein